MFRNVDSQRARTRRVSHVILRKLTGSNCSEPENFRTQQTSGCGSSAQSANADRL